MVACRCIGSHMRRAKAQVKNGGGWHNWYTCYASIKANVVFFEVAHYAASGIETVRTAASEDDGMYFLNHIEWMQQVGLAGCRCASTHIDTAHGRCIAEDDGAAGACFQVGVVSYTDAWDVGYVVMHAVDSYLCFLCFLDSPVELVHRLSDAFAFIEIIRLA